MKFYIELFKNTIRQWLKNEPFQQSAIIAYYTLFSLPSLLVIIISFAGYFWQKEEVQKQVIGQMSDIMGSETANSLERVIANVDLESDSRVALLISIGLLIFGATSAFFQLKKVLNKIWGVREKKSGIGMLLLNRFISLGVVMVIGFMMVVSLVITALVTSLNDYIVAYLPGLSKLLLASSNLLLSFLFIGFLFAILFKFLPDIKIKWKPAILGASLTTVLFLIAEFGLSLYFKFSDPTSVFGGASSIILVMLWVYYSCLILFFGVQFTLEYALLKGYEIAPNRYSEPAFIQELEELKEHKLHLEKQKEFLENWQRDFED